MAQFAGLNHVPVYIGGKWREQRDVPNTVEVNPATGEEIAQVPVCGTGVINEAVTAASDAFPGWSAVPLPKRTAYMYRYRALLLEHQEEVTRIISTEHGKALDDARGELRRGIEVVEQACAMPTLLMGESLEEISTGIDSHTIRQPLGVCAGISPFNFPAMIPLWMMPMAITAGNTFVLKPSPRAAMTAVRLVQLLEETGLPAGVINLVHGEKESVDALLTHGDVKTVSFVGSSAIAKYVYATATAHGKRVQALGGAKNRLTVMPDCNLEQTVSGIISSSFGSAGQRCLAASVVVAVGGIGDVLVPRLVEAAREYTVGAGQDPATQMGPLNSEAARKRVLDYIDRGLKAGARLVLDGRLPELTSRPGFFIGPSIFDHASVEMDIAQDEIFGPVLTVIRAKDLEDAIRIANDSPVGNASSIFTTNGGAARTYTSRVQAGMVGVNIGVPGPMGFFSFGGRKDSFFGDLRIHGRDGAQFYTQLKVITSRWF